MALPTRDEAWALVQEWIQSPNLRKHALAVEAAMRAYARKFGEDEELWGITGLVHDLDYERFPDMSDEENGHPRTELRLFREWGWPEELIDAVAGHAPHMNVPRTTRLAKALFAVDELTGLIIAVALVRPSKDIRDVKVKSVKKKWKDKSFAAGVNRADIELGAQELGVDLWEHVGIVLEAMKGIAEELGLAGKSGE
ncbi:MAG: HDIG domain-containing protein [Chloroflexi bacterium]|nr:HDIG domain-containing protein [Chloroflexota bacterium]